MPRYLPVMIKLIVLIVFFVAAVIWIYLALSAVSPRWFLGPDFTPDVRLSELDRASGLGSFLRSLFAGDFGYSFRTLGPVWDELASRVPLTFLLVGVSTVFSVLLGVGVSLMFESRRRRPATFVHSCRGFAFGLVPPVAILSILIFSYYSYVLFGVQIFPLRGLHSFPPPADPLAHALDLLWHLSLPIATLTLIGVFRIFVIIGSSGMAFPRKAPLKRILLPCTTVDFTVMVSAVVMVEWLWTLPGVGRLLVNSLLAADYNALVGAFVMLLVLSVGLGCVSLLLEFVQRLTGLRKELEKKTTVEAEGDLARTTKLAKDSWGLFLGKKRLVIGWAIVGGFFLLAVFARFVTWHHPAVGVDYFAWLVYGIRTTLAFASLSAFLAVVVGFPVGFGLAYFRGWVDAVVTPILEAVLFLPVLPIFLVALVVWRPSWVTFLAVSLVFLFALAAIGVRNRFLMSPWSQKSMRNGAGWFLRWMLRGVLADFCLTATSSMLLLISIEFLGFGEPGAAGLGSMLGDAFRFGALPGLAWWWVLPPVISIGLLAFGLILLGASLED